MAASACGRHEPTVVPFARLESGALDALFAAEQREWLAKLHWDLSEVNRLVSAAIRARVVRGAAVVVEGQPVGFAFYSNEPDRCLVGDFYVHHRHRSARVNAALAEGVISQIRRSRPRARVESQALCLDARGVAEVFLERGFARHERSYMSATAATRVGVREPSSASIRGWRPADRHAATDVIFNSYKGTVDGTINCQYRTRDGCADLVDALTGTEWCGKLLPRVTRIAVERASGRCVGVAIATRVSPTTVHLGQIAVHPRAQAQGIGTALVRGALAAAGEAGFERVTLAVTRANEPAMRLYERAGFAETVRFPIFTKDPPPLPPAARR